METSNDSESVPCLEKFEREAIICLNTFPDKVTELNNLIDEYTPEAVKKGRENVTRQTATSCLSMNSTTKDCYFHDAGSCYSTTTWDRCKSRNGICKRKYRPGYGGAIVRRRSRPLAHILAILVNRLALCTKAIIIRPSKYILDGVAAIFLQRVHFRHVQCGTSPIWNTVNFGENCGVINNLIRIMRPAAVRLIADTTILKRWLQALARVSSPPNSTLSQAIRTTETIDGWAYELFFHLKYLQVVNFPYESARQNPRDASDTEKEISSGKSETKNHCIFMATNLDANNMTDDVTQTNLWHRIVQLRDHYVILYETLKSNDQFLESDATK